MPSLVFHEGLLNPDSETPMADIVEQELIGDTKETSAEPKRIENGYNPAARRLMWFAVVTVMIVITGLWAWSIQSQFSAIKWSTSPEGDLLDKISDSWNKSLYDENGNRLTTEQLKGEVKKSLTKLFAVTAASSTSSTAPTETTLPNTTSESTTIQTN